MSIQTKLVKLDLDHLFDAVSTSKITNKAYLSYKYYETRSLQRHISTHVSYISISKKYSI